MISLLLLGAHGSWQSIISSGFIESTQSVFYKVISQHFPQFLKKLEDQSGDASVSLPDHVQAEFDAYLKCGILEHGFVKVSCEERNCKGSGEAMGVIVPNAGKILDGTESKAYVELS